jgi:phosphoribosylamine--glycine ligase
MRSLPVPRRILIVGGGGREHALAWRLASEEGVETIHAAPGNPGIAEHASVQRRVGANDIPSLVRLAQAVHADLAVVGPEAPLVAGLADALRDARIPTFGPSARAAEIEGSKARCRAIADAAGIPIARGAAFSRVDAAVDYARGLGGRCVVKADGLAGGKGVTVCDRAEEAEAAIVAALDGGAFGDAGRRIVIEERLEGHEASVIALCDGGTALAFPAARDHKRIGDGDTGPNTGGMGAYAPIEDLGDDELRDIVARIHEAALAELARRGSPFRGALFAGLMLTADGPRLLEFNARLGDPETQVLLPLLDAPLGALLLAAATDRLAEARRVLGIRGALLPVHDASSVGIVLAAPGYPGEPELGGTIEGIDAARATGAHVFHAGTGVADDGRHVTAGGRVLTVVATGATLHEAADRAYGAAETIDFPGRQLRHDIGRPATSVVDRHPGRRVTRSTVPMPVASGAAPGAGW